MNGEMRAKRGMGYMKQSEWTAESCRGQANHVVRPQGRDCGGEVL